MAPIILGNKSGIGSVAGIIVLNEPTYTSTGGTGVVDHGLLLGLLDNDHPQYQLTNNMSNYLAASHTLTLMDHDHGSTAFVTGNIAGTIASNAWSLSIPDFLVTAALSNHSHTNYAGINTSTVHIVGTNLTLSNNNSGITIGMPSFLTTAAQVSHDHGTAFLGTNITKISSGSAGLALSVANKIGTFTTLNTYSTGSNILMTANTSGITINVPNFITTAPVIGVLSFNDSNNVIFGGSVSSNSTTITASMSQSLQTFSNQSSNYVFNGFSSSSVHSDGIPYGISLTAMPSGGNNLTLAGNTIGTLTIMSSGTATIAGGDNITLSQDGNAFTIIGAASGTDAGIAFSMSTSNTSGTASLINAGTLYMQGGDNITVSQNSNTINIIGQTHETYMASDAGSNFAGLASSIVGGNMTYNSSGLTVSIPSGTASNAVLAGSYVSLSTEDVNTTIHITGVMDATEPHMRQLNIGSNTSGTTANISSGSILLAGGNNITLIQNANSITISGPNVGSAQTGISSIAVSNSTITAGIVQFSNVNGISFGLNGSTLTASYASNDYIGTAYLGYYQATSNNSLSLATSQSSLFQHTSVNSNSLGTSYTSHTHSNLYLNLSVSSAYQTSVLSNTFAITSHTHSNLYPTIGHTHGSNVSLSLSNLVGSVSSASNGLTISLTGNAGTNNSLLFADSNGISFGASTAGSSTTITADFGSSRFIQDSEAGNIYFQDYGGISWVSSSGSGTAGYSTSIYGSVTGGGTGAPALSISAGTLSATRGSIVFSNSNNVSFGLSGSTITASIPSVAYGSVYFSDGNNITFGSSVSGSSTTINATVNATGINDGVNIIAAGTQTAGTNATVILSNSNGISFGMSNNSIITASYTQSTHSHPYIGTATTGITGASATINTSQFQLNIPQGSLYYVDSNGISFGASTSGLSTTITASVNTVTAGGAGTGITTASTSGSLLVGTLGSGGLNLGIPSWLTAAAGGGGSVYAGDFITLSTVAGSTSVSVYNTSSFTSLAMNTSERANYFNTSNNTFLTTAAASNHTHSNFIGLATTGITGGSATMNSSQMMINIPIGQVYFADSNGHSFSSSTSGLSTTIYIVT